MTPFFYPYNSSSDLHTSLIRQTAIVSRTNSAIVFLIGSAVLAGWFFNVQSIKEVFPGLATMKANTAVSFVLSGLSLWFLLRQRTTTVKKAKEQIISLLCGLTVALISGLTLCEYLFTTDFGIDEILFKDADSKEFPGRMSIGTAVNFFLISFALLILQARNEKKHWSGQALAFISAAISSLALIAYLYNFRSLYGFTPFSSIALHTTVAFLFLSIGIICSSPNVGWMETVTSDGIGGIFFRRLLPYAIIIPIVLGWLRLQGERQGLYGFEFGLSMLVLFAIVLLAAVAHGIAASLNTVDAERKTTLSTLESAEKRYRTTLDNLIEGCQILNFQWEYLYVNNAAEKHNRRPKEELLGSRMMDAWPGIEATEVFRVIKQAMEERIPLKLVTEFKFPDGSIGWYDIIVEPVPEGVFILSNEITEQKKIETELQKSEERYRYLFESNPLPMWVFDRETLAFLEVNEAASNHYGYSREEFLKMTIKDIRPPEEIPRLMEDIEQHHKGHDVAGVWKHRKKDGTIIDVEITSHDLLFAGRDAKLVLANDITEQKRTSETLQESEKRFRRVVEGAPNAIVAIDRKGYIVLVNSQVEHLFGYSREELLGKPIELLVPERFRTKHQDRRKAFMSQPEARPGHARGGDLMGRRKDGSEVPLEIGLNPIRTGGDTLVLASMIDLTARKRAEEQVRQLNQELEQRVVERTSQLETALASLQESKDNLRLVIDAAHDAYIGMDENGIIVDWNDEAEVTFGWKREEIIGKVLAETIMPVRYRELHAYGLKRFLSTGEATVLNTLMELSALHRDGHEFPMEITISPLRLKDKFFFSAFVRDITVRKQDEVKLQKQQEELLKRKEALEAANKELEAFSYSVSHDLRAPLRHVDGFAELLRKHAKETLDAKSQRFVNIISDSAKHMGGLIDELLVFSRMGRAEMRSTKVSLAQIVQDAMKAFEQETQERNIEWKIDSLPEVEADPSMLRLVFQNLIGNAIKYTRTRPKVVIEIRAAVQNDECVVSVRDNGVGFDMQYAHKLFGVFQRLHGPDEFEGTGIGLANVRRIISRHGGRTWAEGEVDKGAAFYFSLPSSQKGWN